jgi:hypothetical protein
LDLVCGFADEVHDYIRSNMPEKMDTFLTMAGKQGETMRTFKTFKSGDWIMTFEFFSEGPVETDVSCLMALGKAGDPNAVDMVTQLFPALPTKYLGNFGQNPADLEPMKKFIPSTPAQP